MLLVWVYMPISLLKFLVMCVTVHINACVILPRQSLHLTLSGMVNEYWPKCSNAVAGE